MKLPTNKNEMALFYQDSEQVKQFEQAILNQPYMIGVTVSLEHLSKLPIDLHDTDIVVISVKAQSSKILSLIKSLTHNQYYPIVLLSQQAFHLTSDELVSLGIQVYIHGNIPYERFASILNQATSRFNEVTRLKNELEKTKQKLSSLKLVEQAKLILMNLHQLNEKQAYQLIRKTAMDNSTKVEIVAKSVLTHKSLVNF